ncbi:MAG: hypothetical protein WBP11_10080 [Dokdonella sp.]
MKTRSHWSRLIVTIVGATLLFAAQAALAINVSLALPPGTPTQRVLQPGESTTISIDFTNLDAIAGTAIGRARHYLVGFGTRWTLTPVDFTYCGFPQPAEGLGIELPVELQANQTLRCDYTLVREPTTYVDGYLTICTGPQYNPTTSCSQPVVLVIGTLPDVGVSVSQVGAPATITGETMFRIDLSNASTVPTGESNVFSSCQFTGMTNPALTMPYTIELGFAGACLSVAARTCNIDFPITHHGWEVQVPSIPATGSTSCLVKLRPRDPAGQAINDRFASWLVYPFLPGHPIPLRYAGSATNNGQGYDVNPSNNLSSFTLAPLGTPATPVPAENGRMLAALALLLATIGGYRLRRQT